MLLRAIAVFSSHLCQAPGPHAHRRAHGALSQIQLNPVACTSEVPPSFPPSPLSMQLSAGMGGACVPSADAPALVPVCASAFVSHQETAGSARPSTPLHARPPAHSPAYPHSTAAHRPPRTPTARTCFRLPARPWFRTPARTPACFRPPLPSPSLSFPVCLPCLNSALFAES